jgi:hypothetical protein
MWMRGVSGNFSGAILCMERKKIHNGYNKLNETCNVEIVKKMVLFAKYLTRIFAGRYWWFWHSALRNRIYKCHKI